jgi:broad specificity phosphatase PhoE
VGIRLPQHSAENVRGVPRFPQATEPDRCSTMSNAPEAIMYLLRHGATLNNTARPPRLQGRGLDDGLSPLGQWQAERTATLLARHPIAAVYSSPLQRARETAACVADAHRLPVDVVDDITEVDVGLWEGRTWESIRASDAEAYQRFVDDPERHGYAGGESLRQVQDRVVPAVVALLRGNVGRHVVVVAHNVVNRMLWAHLLGLPLTAGRTLSQENCAVSVVRWRNEQMKLLTMNSFLHLHDVNGAER